MMAIQLEFPIQDCLTLEERVKYMSKQVDDLKTTQEKVRKKLFAENSQIKLENKQIKQVLRDLVDLLEKSQFEVLESGVSPDHKSI